MSMRVNHSDMMTAKEREIEKLQNVIIKLKESVRTLKETEKYQREDMQCMRFNH